MERIRVELSGVPETLLGNLGRRAAAARAGVLDDPLAIRVVDRLDYDFTDTTRGARLHALRVATFDMAVRRFLISHPAGTVVALGEGLETQFWRVDNGQVRWLTVDVPETIELRRLLLPDGPRRSSHCGSALDLEWVASLNPADKVLVTAQGLLPYFQRDQVYTLIAALAERLPGSLLVFDVVPVAMLNVVRRGSGRERDLAVELWSWLFDPDERATIRAIPGVDELRDLAPPLSLGVASLGIAAITRLPIGLRYLLPVISILQARFRTVSANESGMQASSQGARMTPLKESRQSTLPVLRESRCATRLERDRRNLPIGGCLRPGSWLARIPLPVGRARPDAVRDPEVHEHPRDREQ
ncbi:MAG TPA: class I SAM-dependent methyltransferase [Solirubrobacteraceae bacterium]|nr:class I SAM-dependent methyltransferase [Solirubrobacteraceae bacterium]